MAPAWDVNAMIVMTGLGIGNNPFGGWHYVTVAKGVGVMKDGSSQPIDDANTEFDRPLDPNISGIELEDFGGAYFRMDGDSNVSAQMLDFLRSGAQPGPALLPN